jgi:hypothetical protein
VTRIEISSRADVLGGKQFGLAGPYERITGKVFFAVDPAEAKTSFRDNVDRLRERTPLKALLQAVRNWSKQNQEMV